jgi:hypothetical protein
MKPDIITLAETPEGRAVLGDWYEEKGRLDVARLYRDELPPREGPLRKRVSKLTEEERARLDEYSRRWIAVGRSTRPADREKAEAALLVLYRLAGLYLPKRLIWASSPAETLCAVADAAVEMGVRSPDVAERSCVDNKFHLWLLERRMVSGVVGAAYEAAYEDLGLPVRGAVDDVVNAPVSEALESLASDLLRDKSRDESWRACVEVLWRRRFGAQLWVGAYWLIVALASYALDVLRLDLGRDLELRARAYAALCESCCLFWPHRDFAVLCEKPRTLKFRGKGETPEQMCWQELVVAEWDGWEVVP